MDDLGRCLRCRVILSFVFMLLFRFDFFGVIVIMVCLLPIIVVEIVLLLIIVLLAVIVSWYLV